MRIINSFKVLYKYVVVYKESIDIHMKCSKSLRLNKIQGQKDSVCPSHKTWLKEQD